MPNTTTKCHVCIKKVIADENGDCPNCRTNLLHIDKDPNEELQFFCVVCDDFFFACRDDTGYDQAPCPNCWDISNTADFHVDSMVRDKLAEEKASMWLLKLMAILLFSGVGIAIIRSLFGP